MTPVFPEFPSQLAHHRTWAGDLSSRMVGAVMDVTGVRAERHGFALREADEEVAGFGLKWKARLRTTKMDCTWELNLITIK